jgi:toxin ParE1/3/4
MNQFRVSDSARADLDEIWFVIAQDNPVAADLFLQRIISRFPLLTSMPYMGRARKELAPDLRSFPVRNYVIFYRSTEGGIEVVRILHGARDLPPLFE